MPERFQFDVDGESVTAIAYSAVKPIGATLLLGPGATAGQEDRFMVDYATGLAARGVLVVTYDFPFRARGRRSPDPGAVLEACCREAIAAARQCRPKNRLFIGGKSLGGRIAAEVAAAGGAEVDDVAGVVLLGYPLHPVGKPTKSRLRHLPELPMPVLIVQGTRDVFGTAEELDRLSGVLPKGSQIRAVDGGDHSFAVPKQGALSRAEVHAEIQDDVARWIAQVSASATARAPSRPRRNVSRVAAKLEAPHENKRAGAKASYAREAPPRTGPPSRKSTRSGANRAKPDTNLVLRSERANRSPEARFRTARARAGRVRGSAAS